MEGKPVEVRFNESDVKKIILFSSTSCHFCKKQNPNWNQLIAQIDRRKYEVIELFRDKEAQNKVEAYLKDNSSNNEEAARVFFVADKFLNEKKLNSTPITLVVGTDGVVEKAWFGLWNKSAISEVNSSLDVSI